MNSTNLMKYSDSVIQLDGTKYFLQRNPLSGIKKLVVEGNVQDFVGVSTPEGIGKVCDLSDENADVLRDRLKWLAAVPLGLQKSFGFGDRLGLATPGHVNALKGIGVSPIFSQQSVRENARTGRSPKTVMNEAMWGVFQSGWKKPWGADADHLKTPEVLEEFIQAGFTFFTIDPGDHVDRFADQYPLEQLWDKLSGMPWELLRVSQSQMVKNWLGKEVSAFGIRFDEKTLLKALIKYGRAITHTAMMYQAIQAKLKGQKFDFEVSVDETDSPTSIEEHYFIASELKRLGVEWTSLAPRFIGRFEKGVDYIGDLGELNESLLQHAAVADSFGNYKISLHSGSDKFSVYAMINQHTHGKLHVKTAGTSYLEGLKVIAVKDSEFFQTLFTFARERYPFDKVSYHVSADLDCVERNPANLLELLNEFNARQVFHVTYGSVLDRFKTEIFDILKGNEDTYYKFLTTHFRRHLLPLNS